MVRYYFDTFKHLNSFDIVPYQDMIDSYLKNQSLLEQSGKEKLGGDNERPVNSDLEKVDHDGFWLGYSPRYYNIDPLGDKVTQAKADVDYIFKNKHETVVVLADCFTDESYGEFLNRKQGKDKGRKLLEIK